MFGAIVIFVIVMIISAKISSKNNSQKSFTPDMPGKRIHTAGEDKKRHNPEPFSPKNSTVKTENAGQTAESRTAGLNNNRKRITPAVKNKSFWNRASRMSSEKERLIMEMEDRENDWLAKQMREEEQLAKKMCFR